MLPVNEQYIIDRNLSKMPKIHTYVAKSASVLVSLANILEIDKFDMSESKPVLKIHIYNQFPVDTYGHWCQIIIRSMYYLILKIFHHLPLVNLVLEFKIGFGAPKP